MPQRRVITNNSNITNVSDLAIPRDYLDYRQVCILMTGEITAEITSRPEKTRGNIMKNLA